ncbi:transcription factor une12 [Quercus suber]|uniref:Transcription factor une12 n=1 Tax=Quercus suber TaxID=58331 RepID=A0AAW0L107_QUESU
MANNLLEATNDDFLWQILGLPSFALAEAGLTGADGGLGNSGTGLPPMMLQLSSDDLGGGGGGSGGFRGHVFLLRLSLEQGKGEFLKPDEASSNGKRKLETFSLFSFWLVRK